MPIPVQVSAERALARNERYQGQIDPSGLPRLAGFQPRQLVADLQIRRHITGYGRVGGSIQAELTLECRVCTLGFCAPLSLRFDLVLARDEAEEARLMDQAEPLLITDDVLPLHRIVEDEVLLGLPMMPRCPTCENARPAASEAAKEEVRRPFAALKELGLKGGTSARGK